MVKLAISVGQTWGQHVQSEPAPGAPWMATSLSESQDAPRVQRPLFTFSLSQWQDLQDHGGGPPLQQGVAPGKVGQGTEENGGEKSETGHIWSFEKKSWR